MFSHNNGLPVTLINIKMDYDNMAKITFELDDKLDEKFRKTIAEVKGLRRGVIEEAIGEAIEKWIYEQAKRR